MRSGHPRAVVAFVALVFAIVLLGSAGTLDALAQRKGGGGQKEGRGKEREREVPPPKLTLPDSWAKSFNWRSIGPANMGGRITAVSVFEADPSTYWVATASGGLIKTTNNGVTFVHQFDHEGTVSIGDVCVAPSNKDVVWVGSGENNPRNSVSYGDGVYKSTDGGTKWTHMGLKNSYQIGRIAIHPKNPDVVYVGALGRLYGPNEDRGLFKTTDGGKTWDKILYVDDNTGVIDVAMHPTDPDTLYVATWERQRDGFDSWPGGGLPDGYDAYDPVKKWGKGSGIHKTTDGGKTFTRLTDGLPTNAMGRIGLDIYRADPNVIFAIIDCEKIGMGVAPKKAATASNADLGLRGEDVGEDAGAKVLTVVADGPADKAGVREEDVVTKAGTKDVKAYADLVEFVRGAKPGDKVKLELKRGEKIETVEVILGERAQPKGGGGGGGGGGFGGPGGPSQTRPYGGNYGGQRENVQDTQGPDGHQYGGVYRSGDGGKTWKRVNSINPRPMYFSLFRVDPSDEKYQYVGGVSLARSTDGGKTFRAGGRGIHADHHALWIDPKDGRHQIIGTDGGFYVTYDRGANWDHFNHLALGQFYHVAVCTKKPYWIYGGLQDNGCWGIPSMSLRGGLGPVNEDVIPVNGGDGYVCRVDPNDPDQVYYESQNGGMGRWNMRTGERRSIKPIPAQGEARYRFNWNTPHILSAHNSQIWYCGGNFVFKSVKKGDEAKIISPDITRTKHGSATALAESPRNPDVLWAGTDDGNLWVTKNGGKDWKNVADKVGLNKPHWVATIEASRFADGRAYVTFDGHRLDTDDPLVYVTDDYGDTWKSIRGNLPVGSTRCLREDVTNRNLLFCGTEFALFASLDRGGSWTKINNNLPTVAVHEVAIHPTAGEIVAATHGRSLWILDVTALRQMATEAVKDKPTLYKPNTLVRWQEMPGRGRSGRRFVGQNPPTQAQVYYSLPKKADKVALRFHDIEGKKVGELNGATEPGLHRIGWDTVLRTGDAQQPMGGGFGGGGRFQGRAGGRQVPPGAYRVVLVINGEEQGTHSFAIEGDPNAGRSLTAEDDEEDDDEDKDR